MEEKVLDNLLQRVTKLEQEVDNLTKSLSSEEISEEAAKSSHAKILEEWNSQLPQLGVPKITSITGKRAKLVTARIREYGKDSFHQCIEEVKQSSFLQGKSGGWSNFTFDWMLKPSNFPKVLEGNYNDNRKKEGGRNFTSSNVIPESWIHG